MLSVRVAGCGAGRRRRIYATTDTLLPDSSTRSIPTATARPTTPPVALVGVNAPYAGFGDSPEAQAARGAAKLGTLVVAPAGQEGPAAPAERRRSAPPARRADVLAVGRDRGRRRIPRASR